MSDRFAFALKRQASVAWLACAVLAGCQVYDPTLLERDAGRDGGAGGTCVGRRPPPRPTTPDGDNVPEIYFGLRDVVLDQEEGSLWAQLGYNLDGYCTGQPVFASACQPGRGATRPPPDGEEGIDNVFGSDLFPLVEVVTPGLEATARAAQMEGVGLPVMRLRNWNGEPNDPRVHVTITQAVVTVPPESDGSVPEIEIVDFRAQLPGGGAAPPPAWEGEDYVWVRADTFLSGDVEEPLVYDDNAYVVDRHVIIRLPDRIEILFPADDVGVMVRLTGGLAVGRINEAGTMLEDIVVAGRWGTVDLLRTAENVGVCMGTTEYNVLRSQLDGIVDVRSDVGSDGTGVECDAISLGVGFTGFRLQLGGVAAGRPLVSACDVRPDGGAPMQDGGSPEPDAGTPGDGG